MLAARGVISRRVARRYTAAMPDVRRPITPALALLAATLLTLASAGCRPTYRAEYAEPPPGPAGLDEAIASRDFPRTSALYANGDVAAGPVPFRYQYDAPLPQDAGYERRRLLALVADPAIFVANLALLPYEIARNPPTERRVYEGVVIEPTYTAAVPLPEERPVEPTRPLATAPPPDLESVGPTAPRNVAPVESAEPPATGFRGRTAATLPSTLPATRDSTRDGGFDSAPPPPLPGLPERRPAVPPPDQRPATGPTFPVLPTTPLPPPAPAPEPRK